MKKIFLIVMLAILLNDGYVVQAKEIEKHSNINEINTDDFWYIIEPVNSTRDYARGFTYNQEIYYGNTLVCVYTVNLAYSYNDTTAVISTFSYSRGQVTSGFSVTASKSVVNGNPAVAKLTIQAKHQASGATGTAVAVYTCKTNGDVVVDLY